MTTFHVASRRTSPVLYSTVEAESRDDAIHMVILACPPGDQIEVMQAQETPFVGMEDGGATGATGATGAATRTAHKKE